MIKRIRFANYRCFGDFELKPDADATTLLLGLNGVGKSTFLAALSVLQRIGGGESRVEKLAEAADFAFGDTSKPIRFEIVAESGGRTFAYALVLELPPRFAKPRVLSESLVANETLVFSRDRAQVSLGGDSSPRFLFDWHQVALPVIQSERDGDAVDGLRKFLRSMVLVSPAPTAMGAKSVGERLPLRVDAANFVDWLVDAQLTHFDAYARIVEKLRELIFPDLESYALAREGEGDGRVLEFVFSSEGGRLVKTRFDRLSDGEKCEVLAAVTIVLAELGACSFCYWDEPDNYLAISEVRPLVTDLRVAFRAAGLQLVVSSHNPQVLDAIPEENVKVLLRDSHLESSRLRDLTDMLPTPESRKHLDLKLLTGSLYDETR